MSVNKWIGIGNLTRDPELRYTPSGVAVANFAIACNERYEDRDGNSQEKVEFINIVVWRQLAEICGKYLHKGKQVYLEGKLQTRSYDDRDGNKRYITEIVAGQMHMLGPKGEGERSSQQESRPQTGRSGYGQQGAQQRAAYQEPAFNPDDDEIPF